MTGLNGRHALITGGGTGIGLAIGRALAAEGVRVTITGPDAEVLEAEAARMPGLFPQVMDVSDEASVLAGFAAARSARGPITIVVANAGLADVHSVPRTTLDFWRRIMSVNLDGAFLTLREALPDLLAADWGRAIAISSVAGLRGFKGGAAYAASKHGVLGLVRSLSEDYLGSPVTFNALCPAYVDTPIVSRNSEALARKTGMSLDDARAVMVNANRHKRLVAPDEVAAAALWLCRPGSESINGQAIEIAGGQV